MESSITTIAMPNLYRSTSFETTTPPTIHEEQPIPMPIYSSNAFLSYTLLITTSILTDTILLLLCTAYWGAECHRCCCRFSARVCAHIIVTWMIFKLELRTTRDLFESLNNIFHLHEFQLNQVEIMNAALTNFDCFVLMSTGSGKSLCFQLPATLTESVTIAISPLKSLMLDQVTKLQALGIEARNLSGDLTDEEKNDIYNGLNKSPPLPTEFRI